MLRAAGHSGIMGERLSSGNVAIALLGNTIPTGAILIVLITMLGPISGAHFNPAVTAVFALRKEIAGSDALGYVLAHCRTSHVRRERVADCLEGSCRAFAMVFRM